MSQPGRSASVPRVAPLFVGALAAASAVEEVRILAEVVSAEGGRRLLTVRNARLAPALAARLGAADLAETVSLEDRQTMSLVLRTRQGGRP